MASASTAKAARLRFRSVGHKDGLVDRVVKVIEEQILDGRMPVGVKLPPERDFSEQLGVSRTVVREAVRILVTKGLLETRHGLGTTVRSMTCDEVVKPMTLFLRTSGHAIEVAHLHQVRSMLEVENAGLAARLASDEDRAELQRICDAMASGAADPKEFARLDDEFHRRLAETTRNPLMVLLFGSIRDLMSEVRTLVGKQRGLADLVMPTHFKIVERVAAGDSKGARQAMREHLLAAVEIQKRLLAQRAGGEE